MILLVGPKVHLAHLVLKATYCGTPQRFLRCIIEPLETLDNRGNSAKVPRKVSIRSNRAGALTMKNVYEVLRQKEMELTRLEKEVEALRLVAPLLSEEKESLSEMSKPALATAVNGPQPAARIPVAAAPTIGAPQPVRAAGWEDTAKRWP